MVVSRRLVLDSTNSGGPSSTVLLPFSRSLNNTRWRLPFHLFSSSTVPLGSLVRRPDSDRPVLPLFPPNFSTWESRVVTRLFRGSLVGPRDGVSGGYLTRVQPSSTGTEQGYKTSNKLPVASSHSTEFSSRSGSPQRRSFDPLSRKEPLDSNVEVQTVSMVLKVGSSSCGTLSPLGLVRTFPLTEYRDLFPGTPPFSHSVHLRPQVPGYWTGGSSPTFRTRSPPQLFWSLTFTTKLSWVSHRDSNVPYDVN